MIHPSTHQDVRPIRAAVQISPAGSAVVVSEKQSSRFPRLSDLLDWITSSAARSESQYWLTCRSLGWDSCISHLLRAGYRVQPSRRLGAYTGLRIVETRGFVGRSAHGILPPLPLDLSAEEACAATLRQLDAVESAICSHWPGMSLGPSVASTGVGILRRYLRAPLGCARHVAQELRARAAYAGGRVERYCRPGSAFEQQSGIAETGPYEVDLHSAYPSACIRARVSGEFVDYGPTSAWADECTITTALVEIPESIPYPPLRYTVNGRIYYPTGLVIGTWSAAELRAATDTGCTIRQVHSVMRFADRSEEFAAFGDGVIQFRRSADEPLVQSLAKAISVHTIGALASLPARSRLTCHPKSEVGCRVDRAGCYEEEHFRPSDREVLPAAIAITGTVKAWIARALHAVARYGHQVTYVHTDGFAPLCDPTAALRDAAGLPLDAWKIVPMRRLEIWAANRRIGIDHEGRERIVAGGIARALGEDEAREIMRGESRERSERKWNQTSRRRPAVGGWTVPYSTAEIDPETHERLARL